MKMTTAEIEKYITDYRAQLLHDTHSHGWQPWYAAGGYFDFMFKRDEPIQILWANGIIRTYERADMIFWDNLPTDGSVKWREL